MKHMITKCGSPHRWGYYTSCSWATSYLHRPFLDFSSIQITHASSTCIFTAAHQGSRVLGFSFPRFLLLLSVRYLHVLFLPFMYSYTLMLRFSLWRHALLRSWRHAVVLHDAHPYNLATRSHSRSYCFLPITPQPSFLGFVILRILLILMYM